MADRDLEGLAEHAASMLGGVSEARTALRLLDDLVENGERGVREEEYAVAKRLGSVGMIRFGFRFIDATATVNVTPGGSRWYNALLEGYR